MPTYRQQEGDRVKEQHHFRWGPSQQLPHEAAREAKLFLPAGHLPQGSLMEEGGAVAAGWWHLVATDLRGLVTGEVSAGTQVFLIQESQSSPCSTMAGHKPLNLTVACLFFPPRHFLVHVLVGVFPWLFNSSLLVLIPSLFSSK